MLGLSVRDFADLNSNPSAKAMSKSAVDRAFVERGDERLNEFESRSYTEKTFVALFVDGKYLLGEQIVLALGVTAQGTKVPLGFVQSTNEHHQPCVDLFKDLLKRGFKFVGSTICYSFMQAVGMVNDHDSTCFRYRQV